MNYKIITVLLFIFIQVVYAKDPLAESVVVVANLNNPESVEIARYYMEKRSIPENNLILLKLSNQETVDWKYFISEVFDPLRAQLVKDKWINAIVSELKDEQGRQRYSFLGHNISYLVTCKGIPLKISNDKHRIFQNEVETLPGPFKINKAAVDSELALLAYYNQKKNTNHQINGYVYNQLFKRNPIPDNVSQSFIKVARLDGPTTSDVKLMIDNALVAEENGLIGRAYIDHALKGGNYKIGDDWMKSISEDVKSINYDISEEKTRATFDKTSRFDKPAIYFGWYLLHLDGPFRNPGFRFPPGAIAVHIHSFSATSMKFPEKSWCGPLVHRGATVTLGNVYEPFLNYTHHLGQFFKSLKEGNNVGDAAASSIPFLSWQGVVIGDPLYRPFKVSLDQQYKNLLNNYDYATDIAQYIYIRKMNQIKASGDIKEAIKVGESGFRKSPGIALGLRLAELFIEQKKPAKASKKLQFLTHVTFFNSEDWGLVKKCADLLKNIGKLNSAIEIYKNLLTDENLPDVLRKKLLNNGSKIALSANNFELARDWSMMAQKINLIKK